MAGVATPETPTAGNRSVHRMAGTATMIMPARSRASRRVILALVMILSLAASATLILSALHRPSTTPQAAPIPEQITATDDLVSDAPVPVSTTDPASIAPPDTTATTSTTSTTELPAVPVDLRLDIDDVFDPVHDQIAGVVTVPIRLPLELGDGSETWSPTLSSVDAGGYVVHLGSDNDCDGASHCRVSTFTARQSLRSHPTVTATGTPVPLPNGLEGVFSDSSCGSDCNNGFITWVEENVLYSVGSRLASGPEVLALAWSAIDSTQAAPKPPEICGPGAPSDSGRVARSISTELADGRNMHWIVACSVDGTIVEVLHEPGDLRWFDIDHDGLRDAIVTTQDGSTTIFAMGGNTPRAAIDISTSGRLVVGDLGCADLDEDGEIEAIDRSTGDELVFITPITVRRTPRTDVDESTVGSC